MWSPFYYYLGISFDKKLSQSVKTSDVKLILEQVPEIARKSEVSYSNSENVPWFDLSLIYTENPDSWSVSVDNHPDEINLITIVAGKNPDKNQREIEFLIYKKLFTKIAAELNWTIFDEETDDGQDDFVIWHPPQD